MSNVKTYRLDELASLSVKDILNETVMEDRSCILPIIPPSREDEFLEFITSASGEWHAYISRKGLHLFRVNVNPSNRDYVIEHMRKNFEKVADLADLSKLTAYCPETINRCEKAIIKNSNLPGVYYEDREIIANESKTRLGLDDYLHLYRNGIINIPHKFSLDTRCAGVAIMNRNNKVKPVDIDGNSLPIKDIDITDYVGLQHSGVFNLPITKTISRCGDNYLICKMLDSVSNLCDDFNLPYEEFYVFDEYRMLAVEYKGDVYISESPILDYQLMIKNTKGNLKEVADTYVKVMELYKDVSKVQVTNDLGIFANIWNSVCNETLTIVDCNQYSNIISPFNMGGIGHEYTIK